MGGRSEITRFTRRRRRLRDESSANGDGDGEGEGETGRTSPSSSSRSTASSPTSPRSADRRMRSPAMVTRSARPRAAAGAGTAGATRAPTSVQCSLEPIVPSECRREAPSKRPWLRAALVAACVAAAAAAAGVLRNAGSVARGGEPPAPFGEVAGAAAALNGTSAWALAERGAPAGADAQLLPDALRALPRQRVALFSANFDYNLDGVALTLNRLVAHLLREGHAVAVFAPSRAHRVIPPPEPPSMARADRSELDARPPACGAVGCERTREAGETPRFVQVVAPSVRCPIFKEYELTLPALGADLAAALRAFRPTVAHIATPDPLGHAAQRWAARAGVPVVCSFHTRYHRYLHYYGLGWTEPLYWWALRRFHARCGGGTFPPSEAVATELRAHGIGNVRLWARGVDTERFAPARASHALRASWQRQAAEQRARPHAALAPERSAHGARRARGLGQRVAALAARALRAARLGLARHHRRAGRQREARAPPRSADAPRAAPADARPRADERDGGSALAAARAAPALEAMASGVPILLLVSRLRWEKGLAGFAAVVRRLEEQRVPHVAVVVGDGGARRALARLLPRAVFTGALAGEALAAAYASADVFLTASETEGWGGTVLEAMASGLPVAAYAASGISQLIAHGRSGLLAPPRDVGALAAHAAALLRAPRAERAALSAAARQIACGYGWGRELRRMERYYHEARGGEGES